MSPALFNRTNIKHMANSVSPRLNILCKCSGFFPVTLFARLYVENYGIEYNFRPIFSNCKTTSLLMHNLLQFGPYPSHTTR